MSNFVYIFGSTSLLLGSYLFYLAAKSMTPVVKSPEVHAGENTNDKKSYEWLMIPAILLILNGMYDLFWSDGSRYELRKKPDKEAWVAADSIFLVEKCIKDSKGMAVLYRKATTNFCACSVSKVMAAMSKREYEALVKESEAQQSFVLTPITKDCQKQFQLQVK
jgi:hypothetical protein